MEQDPARTRTRRRGAGPLAVAALLGAAGLGAVGLLAACSTPAERTESSRGDAASASPSGARVPSTAPSSPTASSPTASSPTASSPTAEPSPTTPLSRRVEPRRSYVTIPRLGLRDFPVVRYRGSPDDAPGTRIQDADEMASPRGPRGGVGPGEVGNFIVTGHRLTGAAPLRNSPSLERGDRIVVRSGGTVHTYEVVRTRETSFRSPASLAAQRAPVPGRPGVEPTRAMLTLSTCATLEDHAEGNYWADEFDNPEHRIDKVAVLVSSRPAS